MFIKLMPLDRWLDWGRVDRKRTLILSYLNSCTEEYLCNQLAESDQSEPLPREGRILKAFWLMRGRQFALLMKCGRWRSRSVGLIEECLNECLHWLSLRFSKLIFPPKLVLSVLPWECILWANEVEEPVFLLHYYRMGYTCMIGVSTQESHSHCLWTEVSGTENSKYSEKNHFAIAS